MTDGTTTDSLHAPLARSAIILTIGNLGASVLNYGSNIVFGRLLGPLGYAELSTLLSLTVVLGVVATAGQTVLAERISHYRLLGDRHTAAYLGRHAAAHMGTIGIGVAIAVLVSTPLLMSVFQVREPGPMIALAALCTVTFVFPVALGMAQGLELSGAYAVLVLAAAAGRLVVGSIWGMLGGGPGGALAGQAIGIVLASLVALVALRGQGLAAGHGALTAGFKRRPNLRAMQASGTYILFAVLSNVDMIAAKAVLSPYQAGLYACVSAFVKIVAYLPAAALILVVPRIVSAADDAARRSVLRWGALMAVTIMALASIPLVAAPEPLVRLMFGSEYVEAAAGVRWGALAGCGLGLISLLVTYAVVIDHGRWQITLVVGMATFALMLVIAHETAVDVIRAQVLAVIAALLVNEATFHALLFPRRTTSE